MSKALEERITELERRVARVLQAGVIEQADYDTARVRVRIGGRLSDWIPWATSRAGGDVDWWAPEIGEQVEVRAPNGEMREARVTPAYYSDDVPPPANSPDIRLIRFGNGAEIIHDRAANRLAITTPDDVDLDAEGHLVANIGGTCDVTAGGSASLTSPEVTVDSPQTTFTGAVTVKGPLAYQAGMSGSGGSGGPAARIDGTVEATDDVTASGVSLNSHTHPGDSGGTTGGPQ